MSKTDKIFACRACGVIAEVAGMCGKCGGDLKSYKKMSIMDILKEILPECSCASTDGCEVCSGETPARDQTLSDSEKLIQAIKELTEQLKQYPAYCPLVYGHWHLSSNPGAGDTLPPSWWVSSSSSYGCSLNKKPDGDAKASASEVSS